MNVCLVSAFRNAAAYVHRYVAQVEGLAALLEHDGDELTCIWGEGDSTDDTRAVLDVAAAATGLQRAIVDVTHGGPVFGSVVDAQRFRQLAHVGNTLWAHLPADADVVVYVEADLVWQPETLLCLIDQAHSEQMCFAPAVMCERPAHWWYDTWAFRIGGAQFTNKPPHHPALLQPDRRIALDSAGSCLAMPGDVARAGVWPEADVFVGLCRTLREADAIGGQVWLDRDVTIWHPRR